MSPLFGTQTFASGLCVLSATFGPGVTGTSQGVTMVVDSKQHQHCRRWYWCGDLKATPKICLEKRGLPPWQKGSEEEVEDVHNWTMMGISGRKNVVKTMKATTTMAHSTSQGFLRLYVAFVGDG